MAIYYHEKVVVFDPHFVIDFYALRNIIIGLRKPYKIAAISPSNFTSIEKSNEPTLTTSSTLPKKYVNNIKLSMSGDFLADIDAFIKDITKKLEIKYRVKNKQTLMKEKSKNKKTLRIFK
jgi:hypothetical protein